ncbi:MAG: DUF4037 domain-containing protein [Clostridia bacterium]|nr:DUF4037 domain-containing protein [Clostridia bacterium]
MKGLELSYQFYLQHGLPMLQKDFSHILPFVAVGMAGSGSECFGYDDELSHDHDFEPGFCIFIPDEDVLDRKSAFELERMYAKLPKEFMGFKRSPVSAVGGNRHGVIRMSEFFEAKTGSPKGELTIGQWLSIPEYALLEAINGAVFCDNYGEFSQIREAIGYFPEDIRLKRLAGNLLIMGQSGQYNYNRCVLRGETASAQLALFEFAKSAINVAFLLNKKYMPYYKWSFRALREISPQYCDLAKSLEVLISTDNSNPKQKQETIEGICRFIADEINAQGITKLPTSEMESQAYAVNDMISNNGIRNMNILSGV